MCKVVFDSLPFSISERVAKSWDPGPPESYLNIPKFFLGILCCIQEEEQSFKCFYWADNEVQVNEPLSHVAQTPRFIVNVAGISWRRQINWSQSINNNLSHAVIRLVSCTAVAIVHHWQFYLDKIATAGAQAKSGSVLCASGAAIRIQWGNLRSIYHTWESHRLAATCIRKPCTWTSYSSFCIWSKSHCQSTNLFFCDY